MVRLSSMSEDWSKTRWFLTFAGIADAWLWGFDADGRWRLRHDNPAMGSLAILPMESDGPLARIEDALWIADCVAFDHDAPVGIRPSLGNPDVQFPYEPIRRLPEGMPDVWYFDNLTRAFEAAADARFGDSYCLRYHDADAAAPGTDFEQRFAGRQQLVSLYAMATRQADVLSEYLCLYRVLEAADGGNGMSYVTAHTSQLESHDFGELWVIAPLDPNERTNAFDVYQRRARAELSRQRFAGPAAADAIAAYLYAIRNSLAHGKTQVRVGDFGPGVKETAAALPIVKLLARLAVEP